MAQMAKNKAGGNSRKIGRNEGKPWKKRYDGLNICAANKRLRAETKERRRKAFLKRMEKRLKKGKPMRGHARALRRLYKQRQVSPSLIARAA
jgi:enoyl reductase-like protein